MICVFVLGKIPCLFSFRETVTSLQAALITATNVAKSGNPDPLTMTDWVNISCK